MSFISPKATNKRVEEFRLNYTITNRFLFISLECEQQVCSIGQWTIFQTNFYYNTKTVLHECHQIYIHYSFDQHQPQQQPLQLNPLNEIGYTSCALQ